MPDLTLALLASLLGLTSSTRARGSLNADSLAFRPSWGKDVQENESHKTKYNIDDWLGWVWDQHSAAERFTVAHLRRLVGLELLEDSLQLPVPWI